MEECDVRVAEVIALQAIYPGQFEVSSRTSPLTVC